MKTIKELNNNFESMDKDLLNGSYRQALNDVLEVIKEEWAKWGKGTEPVIDFDLVMEKRITG